MSTLASSNQACVAVAGMAVAGVAVAGVAVTGVAVTGVAVAGVADRHAFLYLGPTIKCNVEELSLHGLCPANIVNGKSVAAMAMVSMSWAQRMGHTHTLTTGPARGRRLVVGAVGDGVMSRDWNGVDRTMEEILERERERLPQLLGSWLAEKPAMLNIAM
ncbi:hypothetical protein AK812_SmicGene27552 [Symbiodinium microadriaticum]|uniref:Uncharacterized protein n=1 Tax=Symbiodinium microadriaticum TaxID=2951 RepID=A0A1Q9D6W0_SYMMI|nr:hypothetical protein AK812_SmicGene27552 [Symbiodinium microadriaticum]